MMIFPSVYALLVLLNCNVTICDEEVVNTYRKMLPRIIEAYTNNIYITENRVEPKNEAYPDLNQKDTFQKCNQYISHACSNDKGEYKIQLSTSSFFIVHKNPAKPHWSVSRHSILDSETYNNIRNRESRDVPVSARIPYTLWLDGYIDVRAIIMPDEFYRLNPLDAKAPVRREVVKVAKVTYNTYDVYRFYYSMFEIKSGIKEIMSESNTDHDGIECFGYFDVAPQLEWVIVHARSGDYSWDVSYEGMISGIPAVKKVTSKAPFSDPYITLNVLELKRLDKVDDADYQLATYGLEVPPDPYAPPVPPYLYFAILGGIVVIALGAFFVYLSYRTSKIKPSTTNS